MAAYVKYIKVWGFLMKSFEISPGKVSFLNSQKIPSKTINQRTMLKLLFVSLKGSFLMKWTCEGESGTASNSNIKLFLTMGHGFAPVITIVTMSSILDVLAAALRLPLYVDIR